MEGPRHEASGFSEAEIAPTALPLNFTSGLVRLPQEPAMADIKARGPFPLDQIGNLNTRAGEQWPGKEVKDAKEVIAEGRHRLLE